MKKMCLGLFHGMISGFTGVAWLAMRVVEKSIKMGGQKLFLGLIEGQNRVYLGIAKLIFGVKRGGIMTVHFAEYPLPKAKKANSSYVIREK